MHLLTILTLSIFALAIHSQATATNNNSVVATVNDLKITTSDYIDFLDKTHRKDEIAMVLEDKDHIFMSYFIYNMVQSHEAYRLGLCNGFGHFQTQCINAYEQFVKKEAVTVTRDEKKLKKYYADNYEYLWKVDKSRIDFLVFKNIEEAKNALSLAQKENSCLLSEKGQIRKQAVVAGANKYIKIGPNKYQVSDDVIQIHFNDIVSWTKSNNFNLSYKKFNLEKDLKELSQYRIGEIVGPLESPRGYYLLCMSILPSVDHIDFKEFKSTNPDEYFLLVAVRRLVEKANIATKYNLADWLKK